MSPCMMHNLSVQVSLHELCRRKVVALTLLARVLNASSSARILWALSCVKILLRASAVTQVARPPHRAALFLHVSVFDG